MKTKEPLFRTFSTGWDVSDLNSIPNDHSYSVVRVNHFLFLFPPKFTLECKHEEQWRRSLGLDAGRIQMGKCPLSGHPPSPWGPLWDNSCKIKGQQHHSRPTRKSKLSQRSVSQADGGAKPSWVIYAYSRGHTLLKAHDTFISSCMWCWNLHLLLPSHFHPMRTRKVRASPFITHAEKMQCELGHHLQPHRNPGLTPRLSSRWLLPEPGWPLTIPSVSIWVFLLCLFWLCGPSAGLDWVTEGSPRSAK